MIAAFREKGEVFNIPTAQSEIPTRVPEGEPMQQQACAKCAACVSLCEHLDDMLQELHQNERGSHEHQRTLGKLRILLQQIEQHKNIHADSALHVA